MNSPTQELLGSGGFTCECHPDLARDVETAESEDPGCWIDMRVTLDRIRRGSCRSDDWVAPLRRKYADIGEIKRRSGPRLYRLYVNAPRNVPGVLYLLHFAWKSPGTKGLQIQDRHIDEAFDRLIQMPRR